MGEQRRYSGLTQEEAVKKFEADRAAMEVAGFVPDRQAWSKEDRRLRPDLHHLDVEWGSEEPWTGVRFYPTGDIRVHVSTADEARNAIEQLKMRKKEMVIERKDLTAAATGLRVEHRAMKAGRTSVRGKGFVNDMQRASRQAEDEKVANRVAAIERAKLALDRQRAEIDRLILQLESKAR